MGIWESLEIAVSPFYNLGEKIHQFNRTADSQYVGNTLLLSEETIYRGINCILKGWG